MKIDESSIDHNALRLIRDITITLNGHDNEDIITAYGFITGVLEMAKAMKEVLEA